MSRGVVSDPTHALLSALRHETPGDCIWALAFDWSKPTASHPGPSPKPTSALVPWRSPFVHVLPSALEYIDVIGWWPSCNVADQRPLPKAIDENREPSGPPAPTSATLVQVLASWLS